MPVETLKDIAREIEATGKPKRVRVRRLLAIIGQERRGKLVNKQLRVLLKRARLKCEPDFENIHVDDPVTLTLGPKLGRPAREIEFRPILSPESTQESVEVADEGEDEVEEGTSIPEFISAPDLSDGKTEDTAPIVETAPVEEAKAREVVVTIRQGISAAGQPPICVRRNEPVSCALTRMIEQDFSQLLVVNGERSRVEGIFSWQSYGQAIMRGERPECVQDCMSHSFSEVNEERPLFDAVREVLRHGILVVRSKESKLCGLVTHWDVAGVFIDLAEPFLLLGQIENHLRDLVERMRLAPDELRGLADERDTTRAEKATKVDDLSLGELIRGIQNNEYWSRLGLKHDRSILLNRLEKVRRIRNRVMHFDADGITESDKNYLKETRRILQEL